MQKFFLNIFNNELSNIKLFYYPSEKEYNEWYATAKISGIKLCEALKKQYGFDAICLCQLIYMDQAIIIIRLILT